MADIQLWIEGARLRTLPAAAAPVIIGSAIAADFGGFSLLRALLALSVALALQIGCNYANDYSDGIRGTDEFRQGPPRLTASGTTSPKRVLAAALISFAVAGVFGLILLALSGTWILLTIGIAAIAAAWFYTGGKRPYGYLGLGEIFVLIFFGYVATLGTIYTQILQLPKIGWIFGTGIGLIACAILMVNNIRDIPTDIKAGKRTLAVRLGDTKARYAFTAMLGFPLFFPALVLMQFEFFIFIILLPAVWVIAHPVLQGAKAKKLIPALKQTGFYELAYAMLGSFLILWF
ncbi:MAG: 1,4-dihydroxy-2-naphthoate polyprenyltransferase [Arcanobacterium sp.]|nr:1,4-dihydroxy-2-naphthoate polyprenyltransferase [Arcanobacterium sp.]